MNNDLTTLETFSLTDLDPSIQEKIFNAANMLKNSTSLAVDKIRLDAKSFIFPDGTEVQSFAGIIVTAKHANIKYEHPYAEGQTNPIECFAILEDSEDANNIDLVPHSLVEKPCSINCKSCPNFQWKSDTTGSKKGKACGEFVISAVVVPSIGNDDQIFILESKKANAKAMDTYLANTNKKYGHPIVVTTQFTMGQYTKWAQTFSATGYNKPELITNLTSKINDGNSLIQARITNVYSKTNLPNENSQTDYEMALANERK